MCGRYVRQMALQALSRLQARALIIERATAVDKVRSFLLEMAERPASAMSDALILPLSRQDIADYLGLSAETVGRALAQLTQTGAITLAPRQGVLISRRSTSGQDDGPQS